MIKKIIICSLVFVITAMMSFTSGHDGPVIGVLTEELTASLKRAYPNYTSYIAASYVKAVEGSGGRVVPILIGQSEEYYRQQISTLNGVVFPGGACLFDAPKGYAEAGSYIFRLATEVNEKGDHFPILGVCLGFELLLHLANDAQELRTNCNSENIGLPLKFSPGYRHSRLFGKASIEILSILSSLPVTSNHHQFCITHENMTKTGLKKEWKILSKNTDANGLEFVSSVESVAYPFAGIQFHPEKNMYEWGKSQNNPHSATAILSARYFYDWIVNEARKSQHAFKSKTEMYNSLIDNNPTFFTAKQGLYFEQVYLFQ